MSAIAGGYRDERADLFQGWNKSAFTKVSAQAYEGWFCCTDTTSHLPIGWIVGCLWREEGITQAEIFYKRVEISIREQQGHVLLDAECGNDDIGGLSNRNAVFT